MIIFASLIIFYKSGIKSCFSFNLKGGDAHFMNRLINTVIAIALLSFIAISFLFFAINHTIDLVDYNHIETVSIEDLEQGKVKKRFIRLEKPIAFYLYSIKGYNVFSSPDKPSALYFPIIKTEDFNKNTLVPEKKFKIVVRDKNYNREIINHNSEITLSEEVSFDAKIVNDIPQSIREEINNSPKLAEHFDNELICLDKGRKPLSLIIVILMFVVSISSVLLIVIIIRKGGVEIVKIFKDTAKVRNVKDNIGDL